MDWFDRAAEKVALVIFIVALILIYSNNCRMVIP